MIKKISILGLIFITHSIFGLNSILTHKMKVREQILKNSPQFMKDYHSSKQKYKQLYNQFNDPGIIIGSNNYVRNINELDKLNWFKHTLKNRPWSDDYWPIYKGILGNRYADPMFAYKESWIDYFDYFEAYPVSNMSFEDFNESSRMISPSEKYDLLLGLEKGTLTQSMWKQGKEYYERNGEVETWMGICHGWAPASFMEQRPKKSVVLNSFKGANKLKFFPADIKGLSSYTWSNSSFQTLFMGQRCNEKRPEGKDGRILSPECFDVNPGSLHLVTLNLLSGQDSSFVLDATYDYEVWNQPVFAYSFVYFNLITGKESKDWKEVRTLKKDYKDPYGAYRSKQAKYIVGVRMEIEYAVENSPVPREYDSADWDSSMTSAYEYDLEIDRNGLIIGGEWHETLHPDFLWRPAPGHFPQRSIDFKKELSNWDGKKDLPDRVINYARRAARDGYVIRDIVYRLIELSQ
ncbi:hypothetical protein OAT67_06375 [Bacteriovoracaceae bacterium]|nr:hypothetical protein [Bacteriovoracaceae bacterium]